MTRIIEEGFVSCCDFSRVEHKDFGERGFFTTEYTEVGETRLKTLKVFGMGDWLGRVECGEHHACAWRTEQVGGFGQAQLDH